MSKTLESFARKNRMPLTVTKTVTHEIRSFSKRSWRGSVRRKPKVRWAYTLHAPSLMRMLCVERKNGGGTVMPTYGATRKEAREKLVGQIRGGVLKYANEYDRAVGQDPKIRVPKDLR